MVDIWEYDHKGNLECKKRRLFIGKPFTNYYTLKFVKKEDILDAIDKSKVDDGYDIKTASAINEKLEELRKKFLKQDGSETKK